MEETRQRERHRVKPPIDDNKLTQAQRDAVALAKSQGKDLSIRISDLVGDMDSEAVEKMMTEIMEIRKRPAKDRKI